MLGGERRRTLLRSWVNDIAASGNHQYQFRLPCSSSIHVALPDPDFPASPVSWRSAIPFDYDVHAFGAGAAVILCGVTIPHPKKLIGHSDADVGLHALTDALLGTIAEGDIGVHFPPSDARWRGAASEVFLKHAASLVRQRGGAIVHADITLLCEAPCIGPYRDLMRSRIARMLGVQVAQLSIKATTNEGLEFIGRGEGIAAMATATVSLP